MDSVQSSIRTIINKPLPRGHPRHTVPQPDRIGQSYHLSAEDSTAFRRDAALWLAETWPRSIEPAMLPSHLSRARTRTPSTRPAYDFVGI
jgi:hypothetical protein